ncbi:DUF5333 domain-containing protein [Jannaschia sp. M317]|uniref:DUF5333 domain-containing protein n=1 Tax=Jannaschia sp. M317 TaxID=2867011 RepID=UPI0021A33F0D|nr:DUF5333 domain-containing protein [Jannaschia sp. M317]UWQ17810.1 DUF5333 domain-containing protein [Jannaschia sp. M317]
MRAIAVLLVLSGPAVAETLRPAPAYFVTGAMETSTAQILAVNCPTLSVDLGGMARRTDDVLRQLTEDGFTPETLATRMEDPAEAIALLQEAFVTRHGLTDGAPQAAVCAAGQREIAEETPIGALLLEVEG